MQSTTGLSYPIPPSAGPLASFATVLASEPRSRRRGGSHAPGSPARRMPIARTWPGLRSLATSTAPRICTLKLQIRNGTDPSHRPTAPSPVAALWARGDYIGSNTSHYDRPIRIPAMNTSTPPSPTCRAAETTGVSMKRCRTQVMMPSSTRTMAIAIASASLNSLMRNGRV